MIIINWNYVQSNDANWNYIQPNNMNWYYVQPHDCYSNVGNSMQHNGQVNSLLNDGWSTSVQYYQNSDNTTAVVNVEHILREDVSMDVQNYHGNSNATATHVDKNIVAHKVQVKTLFMWKLQP